MKTTVLILLLLALVALSQTNFPSQVTNKWVPVTGDFQVVGGVTFNREQQITETNIIRDVGVCPFCDGTGRRRATLTLGVNTNGPARWVPVTNQVPSALPTVPMPGGSRSIQTKQ